MLCYFVMLFMVQFTQAKVKDMKLSGGEIA